MAYLYELPNSTSGIDQIAIDTIQVVPGMSSIILFFVFLVVFIGGISRQKIKTGTADYSSWCLLASVSTLLVALMFSVMEGFISLATLVITLSLCILSAVWFFIDRKYTEV